MKKYCLYLIIVFLFSCRKKKEEQQYEKIPFLHESKGTKNYEVVPIGDSLGGKVQWDSIGKNFLIRSYSSYYKYSRDGYFIDSIDDEHVLILDDNRSFPHRVDSYTTWLDNGDKKKIKYIDVLPYEDPEDRDTVEYDKKHLELYKKSSLVKYCYYGYYYYYYYYQGRWYRAAEGGRNFKKQHPEKLPPRRLKNIEIDAHPPEFVKQFYVSTKQINRRRAYGYTNHFSLGYYVIHLGLPGGDTLVYRRLGDALGNLTRFYQLPSSKGGNDSVLFIDQEYNNQKGLDGGVYFSHGGLYVVRPRRKKAKDKMGD